MLARVIESLGIPTVTVTMIPELALKMHASRVVGVEFPFGHSFGNPHNDELMLRVARAACEALEEAGAPGYRLDVDEEWPVPLEIAYKTWHPPQASPIVARMLKMRSGG
ncbi:MAG: hypothetical protein ABI577_10505 [bacterium]